MRIDPAGAWRRVHNKRKSGHAAVIAACQPALRRCYKIFETGKNGHAAHMAACSGRPVA
ncbi:hypothetical protein BCEN4_620022 [Burkholderia cenocepacia]|nr:hypothetical protein BCEN4_620022 [Burkholderia cenocepacia]